MATLLQLFAGLRHPVLPLAAAFFALLLLLSRHAGLLGIPLAVVVASALVRYPYSVTAAAANGRRELPTAGVEDFNWSLALPYLAHAIGFAASATLLTQVLGVPQAVVTLLLALVAPASIGLMAITTSLAAAFNPLAILDVITSIGRRYWLLIVALLVLAGSAALIGDLIGSAFVSDFLGCLVLFSVFEATGRLLHLHRHELSFLESTVEDRRELDRRRDESAAWNTEVERIYGLLSSGDDVGGYTAIDGLMAKEEHQLEGYELLYERAVEWRMATHRAHVARLFIERLAAAGEWHRALEISERELRFDPAFRPQAASTTAQLVAYARSVGHEGTAELLTFEGAQDTP